MNKVYENGRDELRKKRHQLSWSDVLQLVKEFRYPANLSEIEQSNLRERFEFAATGGNEFLDESELLKLFVPELSDARNEYFRQFEFGLIDCDRDGFISWDDYMYYNNFGASQRIVEMKATSNSFDRPAFVSQYTAEKLLWAKCDRDDDERLSVDEYFIFAFVQWSFHEVEYIMRNADVDGDMHISDIEMISNYDMFASTLRFHDEL